MRLIDADTVSKLFDAEFKEIIKLICEGETHLDNLAEGFCEAYRVIQNMPTVDAVPVVHAYWIEYETMSWRHESPKRRKYYRCSNCRTASAVRHKACPNCFARMDADTQERKEKK